MKITPRFCIDESEIELNYITSPGPGGQNVNKVATGVQLRFNLKESESIPEDIRARALKLAGHKVTQRGELVIKATRFRTQGRNKEDALSRFKILLQQASIVPRARKKTRPTLGSIKKRLSDKKMQSSKKNLRQKKNVE